MVCNQCGAGGELIKTKVDRFEVHVCIPCWKKLEDNKKYLLEIREVVENEN